LLASEGRTGPNELSKGTIELSQAQRLAKIMALATDHVTRAMGTAVAGVLGLAHVRSRLFAIADLQQADPVRLSVGTILNLSRQRQEPQQVEAAVLHENQLLAPGWTRHDPIVSFQRTAAISILRSDDLGQPEKSAVRSDHARSCPVSGPRCVKTPQMSELDLIGVDSGDRAKIVMGQERGPKSELHALVVPLVLATITDIVAVLHWKQKCIAHRMMWLSLAVE